MRKRAVLLTILLAIVFIGIVITGYSLYYSLIKCHNQQCFYDYLTNCKRNSYLRETTDTVMDYRILGKENGKCKVDVTLVQIKRGAAELSVLENKGMTCHIPLGVQIDPESNIQDCHGLLKEEIQTIIIQRMHSQIVENLGKISEEATNII